VEAYVAPRSLSDRDPKLDASAFHLVLLATNAQGYRNLIALTTTAHLDGFYYKLGSTKTFSPRTVRGWWVCPAA